jgi:hypothetical protein
VQQVGKRGCNGCIKRLLIDEKKEKIGKNEATEKGDKKSFKNTPPRPARCSLLTARTPLACSALQEQQLGQ